MPDTVLRAFQRCSHLILMPGLRQTLSPPSYRWDAMWSAYMSQSWHLNSGPVLLGISEWSIRSTAIPPRSGFLCVCPFDTSAMNLILKWLFYKIYPVLYSVSSILFSPKLNLYPVAPSSCVFQEFSWSKHKTTGDDREMTHSPANLYFSDPLCSLGSPRNCISRNTLIG